MNPYPAPKAGPGHAHGFTLIELMVTVVILAVLMAIAIPNFRGVIMSNKLSSQSNELLAALQYARSESIRRNVRVTFCQSANGTSCSTNAAWTGWLVFADSNRNNTADADEAIRTGTLVDPTQLVESSNISSDRFNFYPDGLARKGVSGSELLNAKLRVCVKGTDSLIKPNSRDLNIVSGSRMSIETGQDINCAAPGNPT